MSAHTYSSNPVLDVCACQNHINVESRATHATTENDPGSLLARIKERRQTAQSGSASRKDNRVAANPASLCPADQEAITEAMEERSAIQEHEGGMARGDAEREARTAMRVFRYRLVSGKGWCTLIAPGWTLAGAEHDLRGRYGDRFVKVVEHRPVKQAGEA
jgi:hypothetical protein